MKKIISNIGILIFKHPLRLIIFLLLPLLAHANQMMPELRSVVLIGDPDSVGHIDLSQAHGLQLYALAPPGDELRLKQQLEPLFLGQPLNQQLISCLKQEIILYYRAHSRPVVAVYVPEQDVSDGVLQLLVVEGKLGKISVCGNRWFSSDSYKRKIRTDTGEVIRSDHLLADIAWINRNPFRSVDVLFTPGEECGATDIELVACDRFPIQFYVGGDNTGTEVTGHARWFTGFNWGNAFWLNHLLTYQYTTSSDPRRFQSHTFHYTAPLPWKHLFRVFGGYAIVHPDLKDFRSKGTTFQSSLRYTIPCEPAYCCRLGEWTLGFDFKNTNNNLIFVGEQELALITQTVNLTQFLFGYQYGFEDKRKKVTFELELFWSPGKLVPDESNERYNELSPHAKVEYFYGDATLAFTWFFPHRYALYTQARLQLSNQTLLPSEQFGLGGYDTVRGYEEREFNADDALCINVELHSRPLSIRRYFRSCKKNDELIFLIFFDYGLGHLIHRDNTLAFQNNNPHIPETEYLMSFGPGLRYNLGRYLSARADWGIKLHHTVFGDSARSMFHLGLVLSY